MNRRGLLRRLDDYIGPAPRRRPPCRYCAGPATRLWVHLATGELEAYCDRHRPGSPPAPEPEIATVMQDTEGNTYLVGADGTVVALPDPPLPEVPACDVCGEPAMVFSGTFGGVGRVRCRFHNFIDAPPPSSPAPEAVTPPSPPPAPPPPADPPRPPSPSP